MSLNESIVSIIRSIYNEDFIPLHVPVFLGNEKKYLNDCIDSTFVSSVGKYVDNFESMICDFTGAERAVAVVNGTSALHLALQLAGVEDDTEVITQALTFVATTNAIHYLSAKPVFIDVDRETLSLSPSALEKFLDENATKNEEGTYNNETGKRISAVLPMHTFGHPARMKEIVKIAKKWDIPVVEDAAESLGSYIDGVHTGLFGDFGIISFNGNKTITTGGGGVIVSKSRELADRAKHMSTTAKIPSKWEYIHDQIGYNYRMPNINAAIGCAQLEKLPEILHSKREIANEYEKQFSSFSEIDFLSERAETHVNYWLNAILFESEKEKDSFLEYSNNNNVQTRPIWRLQNKLSMNQNCIVASNNNAEWFESRLVNIPSSYR